MMRRVLKPNERGKNGPGMWVRHAGARYVLDETATSRCGAMGSAVYARPVWGKGTPQDPDRLALYDNTGLLLGHADRVR